MPGKSGARSTRSQTANAAMADEQEDAPLTKSMLREVLRDSLKDILLPMLNEAIQPMMLGFEKKLLKKIDDIGKELRPAVTILKSTVAEQGESMETMGNNMESMQMSISELERRYEDLMEKMTSFEDRSRRNNIKFVGFSENSESNDPVGFIQSFLKKTFGAEFSSPPEVDRAHRVGGPPRSSADKPRAFLARIHFYRVKERILKLSREAGQLTYNDDTGTYFPSVKRDPGRYLQPCSDSVKSWLRSMKSAGKVLLLITSSHSDYCRLICDHILGKDFEELFDIIITNALKPGFFSLVPQQRPFRTLVNDVEESEGLPSLEKPGWYSQGNWPHLHELLKTMTGKPEPEVVYFGDSMRSDMFPTSSFGKWETVMVVEEMEGEGVPKSDAAKSNEAQVEPLEKKGKFEDMGMKAPSDMSKQWGSYFVDVHKGSGADEETQKLTWYGQCIRKYSTMAIPSVEHIAALPLDYKFPRFSPDKPCTTGYYPRPPDSLLKRC